MGIETATYTEDLVATNPLAGDALTQGDDQIRLVKTTLGNLNKVLRANTTAYVRTDGSDSNTGLANTAGGAFLTIQKAINVVKTWNLNGFQATIQVADGTYTGAIVVNGPWTGAPASASPVVLQGNTGTPANVVVNVTGDAVTVQNGGFLDIKAFKITSTGVAVVSKDNSLVSVNTGMNFGACTTGHVQAYSGYVYLFSNYTISGGATYHALSNYGGRILGGSNTVTVSGTPAFSAEFVGATAGSFLALEGVTYSGSATGVRYVSNQNSVIGSNGGGANYFPGNSAGSTATGGIYI